MYPTPAPYSVVRSERKTYRQTLDCAAKSVFFFCLANNATLQKITFQIKLSPLKEKSASKLGGGLVGGLTRNFSLRNQRIYNIFSEHFNLKTNTFTINIKLLYLDAKS